VREVVGRWHPAILRGRHGARGIANGRRRISNWRRATTSDVGKVGNVRPLPIPPPLATYDGAQQEHRAEAAQLNAVKDRGAPAKRPHHLPMPGLEPLRAMRLMHGLRKAGLRHFCDWPHVYPAVRARPTWYSSQASAACRRALTPTSPARDPGLPPGRRDWSLSPSQASRPGRPRAGTGAAASAVLRAARLSGLRRSSSLLDNTVSGRLGGRAPI
jgi:hypothetical protein